MKAKIIFVLQSHQNQYDFQSKTLLHRLYNSPNQSCSFLDKAEALVDFQCSICGKMLATRNAAQRHRKEVHSEVIDETNSLDSSLLDTSLLDNSLLDNSSVGESDGGEQSTEGSTDPSRRLMVNLSDKIQ